MRSYWPRYFQGRSCRPEPLRWLNYYVPEDVLASDFRGAGEQSAHGVGLTDGEQRLPDDTISYGLSADANGYSLVEWATLIGFRLHGHYWEPDEDDAGVFEMPACSS